MNLLGYWKVLKSQRKVVLIGVAVTALLAFLALFRVSPEGPLSSLGERANRSGRPALGSRSSDVYRAVDLEEHGRSIQRHALLPSARWRAVRSDLRSRSGSP